MGYELKGVLKYDGIDLAQRGGEARLSGRYVTEIDLSQRGAYSLRGSFIPFYPKSSDGEQSMTFTSADDPQKIVVMTANIAVPNQNATSRIGIAVIPGASEIANTLRSETGDYTDVMNLYPNSGVTRTEEIDLGFLKYSFLWRVHVPLPGGEYTIITTVNHEFESSEYTTIFNRAIKKGIAKPEHLHHSNNTWYSLALMIAMASESIPVKTVDGMTTGTDVASDRKKLKGITLVSQGRDLPSFNGTKLPEDFHRLGPIDKVCLVVDPTGEIHFMHVLADYENVTKNVRKFMLDQADALEALASAYRIVASLGDGDD